jgi:hypothetical protein
MAGEQETLAARFSARAALARLEAERTALAAQQEALHAARAALQRWKAQRQLWQQEQKQLRLPAARSPTLQQAQAEVEATAARPRRRWRGWNRR